MHTAFSLFKIYLQFALQDDIMKIILRMESIMPRFFVDKENINESTVILRGADAHHVARSLRMAVGETITVCDTDANEYECRIDGFEDDREVHLGIISVRPSTTEPRCHITLYQALPKGDKLDTVIQKAVECGVCEVVPFESERCIVRVKEDAEQRKTERRARIAAEAAKQCGRSILPGVSKTVSYTQMIERASGASLCLFCYEGEGTQPIGRVLLETVGKDIEKYPSIAVVVGSEGGFSKDEARAAADAGMVLTGLGKRILRTETAPLFALSCIALITELT